MDIHRRCCAIFPWRVVKRRGLLGGRGQSKRAKHKQKKKKKKKKKTPTKTKKVRSVGIRGPHIAVVSRSYRENESEAASAHEEGENVPMTALRCLFSVHRREGEVVDGGNGV